MNPQSNNGMHPTRDTMAFKFLKGAGGRVMPGVSPLRLICCRAKR